MTATFGRVSKLLFARAGFAALSILVPSGLSAQEALTKEETLNYVARKVRESEGHQRISSKNHPTVNRISFSKVQWVSDSGKVRFTVEMSSTMPGETPVFFSLTTVVLDPCYISEVGTSYHNDELGSLYVRLRAPALEDVRVWAEAGGGRRVYPTRSLELPFLHAEGTNLPKMRKALEHLIALCKAEDDPFGG